MVPSEADWGDEARGEAENKRIYVYIYICKYMSPIIYGV